MPSWRAPEFLFSARASQPIEQESGVRFDDLLRPIDFFHGARGKIDDIGGINDYI